MAPLIKPILLLLAALTARPALAFTGDMTYYTPGLGACGKHNSASDHIVALSPAQYGHDANPNKARVCGRVIHIRHAGRTASATVVDKCMACASGSIDVSPAVFRLLAPLDQGRVKGVEWGYAGASSVRVEELGDGEVRLEVVEEVNEEYARFENVTESEL
ncbi:RlpA-like double-psi beta-barrel-protein domain-containing protein-containing protein [Daldinia caldariorum]|uniref:RlpA-like double-psi beta-barrel-protein domain-containing protein-containing protein n=1 Tax=Daldinia caldariorum TaxID=326644 RepID=UPI0020089007|nr:RlpA-like double-psi beta-barrel-protein domain-containing protein-containing protein [Daldinia caldariorum]KAI1464592.1 RlpA-like double-psi beta-barrel-protein domain-containing protein-containing protein [Daldinia caldariorum]